MKPSYSLIASTVFGLGATVGLCWCADLITTYDFFAPGILTLVVGCIFLLLAAIWVLLFLDWSEALGKQPPVLNKALRHSAKPAAGRKASSGSKKAAAASPAGQSAEKPPVSVQKTASAKSIPSKEVRAEKAATPSAVPAAEEAAPAVLPSSGDAQPAEADPPAAFEPAAVKPAETAPEVSSPAVSAVPTASAAPAAPLSAPVQGAGFAPVPPRRRSSAPSHIEWGSAEQAQEMVRTRREELDRKRLVESQALEAKREKQLAQSEQVQQRRRQAREADAAKWNTHSAN